MFQKVDAYAGDPILSLMERFKEDPRSDKVNLSIGLYYNDDGIIPQLQAVAEAEARLNAEPHGASLYLPMEGLSGYRQAIAPLLFGAEHTALKQNRIASIQTVGGSGAPSTLMSRPTSHGSNPTSMPRSRITWRNLRWNVALPGRSSRMM